MRANASGPDSSAEGAGSAPPGVWTTSQASGREKPSGCGTRGRRWWSYRRAPQRDPAPSATSTACRSARRCWRERRPLCTRTSRRSPSAPSGRAPAPAGIEASAAPRTSGTSARCTPSRRPRTSLTVPHHPHRTAMFSSEISIVDAAELDGGKGQRRAPLGRWLCCRGRCRPYRVAEALQTTQRMPLQPLPDSQAELKDGARPSRQRA